MSLLGNIWVKLGLKSDDFQRGMDNAEKKSSKFGNLMKGVAAKVLTVAAAMKVLGSTFKTLANFEASTSKLASVLGKTTTEIKGLTQSAIDLGRRTQYTASEVVSLQTELAKLGFVESDIKGMQESVLKFAAAVGTDLASAAARAGATMRGFGLTAEQTGDLLEVMAVSTSKSALSFNYLDATLGKLVPVTKAYGFDAKDTITLLGTMANAGIDASSAGTALRRVFVELSNGSSKLNTALGKQPKTMDELIDALGTLKERNLSVADSANLVGKYAAPAFAALVAGADDCRALYGELQNVNGALDTMYDTMTNNVKGAIDRIKSGWEGLILTLQNSTGVIAAVLNRFARGLNIINDLANGMSLADARAKQMGETLMQSGKFTTAKEYQKEIERVKKTLSEGGFDTPTASMSQEELRKMGVQQQKHRKELEQYLSGLEYAAFQKSREEQERALEDMFKKPIKINVVTEGNDDPLADLLDSLSKDKTKEAKDGLSELTAEARAYAAELAEINAYDDEMAATGSALLESWNKEHEAIDEVTQSLVVMNNQTLNSLDGMEQLRDKIADISKDIADSLRRGAIDALGELAEAIGTGNWDTSTMIRALVSPLADAAITIGTIVMTSGQAIDSLQKALKFEENPYLAVAVGAGLIAVGVAAKAGLAALANKGSGNTASGGGNPYVYTGGYGVTPDMLSSAGPMEIEGTVTVKGQDIQIALDNYNANKRR